jgi:transposase
MGVGSPPQAAAVAAQAVAVAAQVVAVAAPVAALVAGAAMNNLDFPSHMKSKLFRDKHRLLKKRITAKALDVWPDEPLYGPSRQIPMAFTIERILWVLMTGCQWYLMESTHGSWQLHYYRFRKLVALGVFKGEFEKAANEYVTVKGGLACLLIDGTHIKARKGGLDTGPSPVDRGKKGSKMTVLTDEHSIPVCATFCGGNESDTTQLSKTLDEARRIHGNLSHFTELLADKGYDSRANRLTCLRHGLRPLILERTRRRRNPPPNGAPAANQRRQARPHVCPPLTPEELARVARRRNAVERCFAWQDNYRRVDRRHEHRVDTFRALQYMSLTVLVYDRLEQLGVRV